MNLVSLRNNRLRFGTLEKKYYNSYLVSASTLVLVSTWAHIQYYWTTLVFFWCHLVIQRGHQGIPYVEFGHLVNNALKRETNKVMTNKERSVFPLLVVNISKLFQNYKNFEDDKKLSAQMKTLKFTFQRQSTNQTHNHHFQHSGTIDMIILF